MRILAALPFLALWGCGTALSSLEEVAVPGDGGLRPFWIARHEVTWREFNRFYEFPEEQRADGVTRPSAGKNYLSLSGLPPEFLEPDRPATGLRYHSAMAYCEWLSRTSGAIYRLPTEREWKLACGSLPGGPLAEHAWFRENSNEGTHPAGLKKPNALGLHDMLGNAWEYCLESRNPPDFEPVLRGGAWNTPVTREGITAPADWSLADPSRPFSSWWFRDDFSQGFRVVRVAGAADRGAREAYATQIEISSFEGRERTTKVGGSAVLYHRVTGRVRNGGGRTLDELVLKVYALDPAGKPHLEDSAGGQNRRATYNYAFPVLRNSAHPGEQARPFKPGESRPFSVDVPYSFDDPDKVRLGSFGATVLHLVFSD